MLLDELFANRIDLGATGTPLEPLDRLRRVLGGPRVWLKRDDLMARALGGNKLRKLELLLAEARASGATAVGSIGGPTSNHLRLVAGAATWLGLAPYAFVLGNADPRQGGNLSLLEILGALVCEVPPGRSIAAGGEWARAEFDERCRRAGQRGYWITFGGSSLVGDLGYVRCAAEIAAQLRERGVRPRAIHCAVGTGGTATGLAVGAALHLPETEVVGYAVSPKGAQVFSGLPSLARQIAGVADRLRAEGATLAGAPRFRFEHSQVGAGYAAPTDEAREAIALCARTEAVFLDPVYTGKAFAGLIAEIRAGRFGADDDLVFVHTGGVPGLFFSPA